MGPAVLIPRITVVISQRLIRTSAKMPEENSAQREIKIIFWIFITACRRRKKRIADQGTFPLMKQRMPGVQL